MEPFVVTDVARNSGLGAWATGSLVNNMLPPSPVGAPAVYKSPRQFGPNGSRSLPAQPVINIPPQARPPTPSWAFRPGFTSASFRQGLQTGYEAQGSFVSPPRDATQGASLAAIDFGSPWTWVLGLAGVGAVGYGAWHFLGKKHRRARRRGRR